MDSKNTLKEKIDASMLSRYTGLLSLSSLPICIVDTDGKVISQMTPVPGFCKHICSRIRTDTVSDDALQEAGENVSKHEEGYVCDCILALMGKSGETCTEQTVVCPRGLTCYVDPVKHDNEIAAYVAGGFAFDEENEYMRFMLNLENLTEGSKYDVTFAARLCSMMQTVNKDAHEVHHQLCQYIASSLSRNLFSGRKISGQSVEEELLEKKILKLESKNSGTYINTNFLFNTLNCIARTAYFESAEKTESLIYYLSELLRFNSDEKTVVHSIQSEIDHIEKYFAIQKVRYNNRLQYSIDVQEGLGECRIINLVLAPIVQNALEHGILLKRDGGVIKIRVEGDDDKIVISVTDSGNGFPEEVLEKLRETSFLNNEKSSLCMINQRLKLYYGESYGVDVVRSDFSGSTVSITIPKDN